jgi:hypothetical protein
MLRKITRAIIVGGFSVGLLAAVWLHAAGSGTVLCFCELPPQTCGCTASNGDVCVGQRVSCNFSLFDSCNYYECNASCCKSGDEEGIGGGSHDPLQ